ncbi:MAG: sensor histidine kinase [Candidatus Limnocylindrales bacterium]
MTEPRAAAGLDPGGFADRIDSTLATLDSEMAEIELLVQQARSEAERHELKRSQTADRVATLRGTASINPVDLAEATAQLVQLTRRAVMMESQVDVLQGKQKVLGRYREALAAYSSELHDAAVGGGWASPLGDSGSVGGTGSSLAAVGGGAEGEVPAAVSRLILTAQEDLRRDIARAMHDGPAQSLTNIVLQAQIVDRLVERDPSQARSEVKALVAMVQATLDSTKSFIFDVRPMVLDDLGLVPTIRRAARERGRRAQVVVDFDSMGSDRRLAMDLESGLFRMIDQALAGYLSTNPRRVAIRIDWGDQIEARIAAIAGEPAASEPALPAPDPATPAALSQMIDERRSAQARQGDAGAGHVLPAKAWREIVQRASSLDVVAELLLDGTEVRLVAQLASDEPVTALEPSAPSQGAAPADAALPGQPGEDEA